MLPAKAAVCIIGGWVLLMAYQWQVCSARCLSMYHSSTPAARGRGRCQVITIVHSHLVLLSSPAVPMA